MSPGTSIVDALIGSEPGGLGETLGQVRIVSLEPGRARIEYRCGAHMCHSGGVAQGGFVAGWIDAAMAHAVMAKFGSEAVPISLELKVSYFAPANPGDSATSANPSIEVAVPMTVPTGWCTSTVAPTSIPDTLTVPTH